MSGWSELPSEIIHVISLRIDNPFDLIHFRSVCSRWRSCCLQTFRPMPSLGFPLSPGACFDYLHILKSRVYLITSHSLDPPRFWLFKLKEENEVLALQSLFGGRTSSLSGTSYPSLLIDLLNSQVIELAQEHVACYNFERNQYDSGFGPFSPIKCEQRMSFLLLDAENKDFMVLGGLSFKCLGLYRSFEGDWTEIVTTPDSSPDGIMPFNGYFYIIDTAGVTKVVKPNLECYSFQRSRPCDNTRKRWFVKAEDKILLVEMCSDIMLEYRHPSSLAERGWFEVSELNEERNDWIQTEDVGGRILFLDKDCSFSCFPNQVPGFKPNTIIFIEDVSGCYQVFEFGVQGYRSLGDIPEYSRLFPSSSWIISNVRMIDSSQFTN